MGPILCTTDYSKNAISALKFGHALSKKLNTPLILLHVFDINVALVTPMSMTFAKMQKEAFQKHEHKLIHFCEEHLGVLPDGQHLKVVVKDNAILEEELMQSIHDHNAEFLVMGMKGSSALKDVLFGSTTKSMIDKSPCPVLAVPPDWNTYRLDIISYATDFEESDIHALQWIVKILAEPLNSELNVVHFTSQKEDNENDQMEWFKDMLQSKLTYDHINYDIIEDDDVMIGLMDYLDRSDSKLVTMLEREHKGFLNTWTHADKVKMMSSRGKVPLLSFNKDYLK